MSGVINYNSNFFYSTYSLIDCYKIQNYAITNYTVNIHILTQNTVNIQKPNVQFSDDTESRTIDRSIIQ